MNPKELQAILGQHVLWLEESFKGKRANLSNVDLRNASLRCVDLRGADLCAAILPSGNSRLLLGE